MVETYTELQVMLKYSAKVGVRPAFGLRVKLARRGSGRWKWSGGYRSKFGLSETEARRALQQVKDLGMSDCLNLLHFHLGSKITNIRQIKGAVNVTPFQGLGEMNPPQLRESTIHPDTRRLVQLTVDIDDGTTPLMDMLLSKKRAADRKEWLETKGDLASLEV